MVLKLWSYMTTVLSVQKYLFSSGWQNPTFKFLIEPMKELENMFHS